jgi:hypothetical protein
MPALELAFLGEFPSFSEFPSSLEIVASLVRVEG